MKILQLINVRWYNACAYYAISLSAALKKRGHQVIVAGDRLSPPVLKAKELGLPVFEDLYLSYSTPWMMAYNVKRLVDLVAAEKIDIINAHRGEGHLVAALSRKFIDRKVPLVRTRGDARAPKGNIFNRCLNHKFTDCIITTCLSLKEDYTRNLKIPENKLVNLPGGIDHEYFSPQEPDAVWKDKLNLPDGGLVVGILGRLSPVKGHKYFIQAAEIVLKKHPRTIFLICGTDAQISLRGLKEMIHRMGREESFRFWGKVKDVREIIPLLDVGVVASTGSETICRVPLEYMAMGKPVVGTKVNAIPEVVENEVNGLLVDPGDATQMAAAIIRLLEDELLRKRMGEVSRQMVEDKFTLDGFARRTEEVYFRLLNQD
jgi:glycosyltransferase involved in cell wall biosynthesis